MEPLREQVRDVMRGPVHNSRVSVALIDSMYRTALCRMLASAAGCEIVCLDETDQVPEGVLVLDTEHLEKLSQPVAAPERIVLITHDDPGHRTAALSRAWDLGVHSVVYDKDPLSTAVLAILAARLRSATVPVQVENRRSRP